MSIMIQSPSLILVKVVWVGASKKSIFDAKFMEEVEGEKVGSTCVALRGGHEGQGLP